MKKVILSLGLLIPTIGFTQQYSIDWYKVAGGGGTSTGGVFSVSGTIGQPDASAQPMTGGNFSLTGGFWGLIAAVQTPGEPLLTITRSGGNVIVSWPSPSTGFGLQENVSVGTTNWNPAAQIPADNGTTKSVTIPMPTGNKFYRLKNP